MWFKNNAALVFWILHTVGLAGYHFMPSLFLLITPVHLLIITVLLLWEGVKEWNIKIIVALFSLWIIGFTAEVVGVKTGLIFGDYSYGSTLGFRWMNVPLTIGINWMSLVFCAYSFLNIEKLPILFRSILAGLIIVVFDYYLEPVAIRYDWWCWEHDYIPFQNYFAWFLLVFLMTLGLSALKVKTISKSLAINFVLAQFIFFILLEYIN